MGVGYSVCVLLDSRKGSRRRRSSEVKWFKDMDSVASFESDVEDYEMPDLYSCAHGPRRASESEPDSAA